MVRKKVRVSGFNRELGNLLHIHVSKSEDISLLYEHSEPHLEWHGWPAIAHTRYMYTTLVYEQVIGHTHHNY